MHNIDIGSPARADRKWWTLTDAIVAFAASAACFVLIRERDFVTIEEAEHQVELAVAA